jgi:hypothetical protein
MAAFITSTIGLDISVYDQIAAGLTGPLKAAPGFRSHAAHPAGGGIMVTEVRAVPRITGPCSTEPAP